MASEQQGRRAYDASGRRAQARANRARVLDAARALFVAQGYARTSVAQIAAAAGVSAPTVFSGGTKATLLKEAVETALVGDVEAPALHERPAMRHVHAGGDAPEVLRRLAALIADRAPSVSPVAVVLYAAADTDPEIADVARVFDDQRLAGADLLAGTVTDRLGDADPDRRAAVRDTIWTMTSPRLYELLVVQRGWSLDRYRDWIERALLALVL